MSVQLEAVAELAYVPDNEEWEGTLTPHMIQTYPDYFLCSREACEKRVLHRSEIIPSLPADKRIGPGDAIDRCPRCGAEVTPKPRDVRGMEQTHYCAPSVCEVNSAMETYLLQLQRQVDQVAMELRGAEERAEREREDAAD